MATVEERTSHGPSQSPVSTSSVAELASNEIPHGVGAPNLQEHTVGSSHSIEIWGAAMRPVIDVDCQREYSSEFHSAFLDLFPESFYLFDNATLGYNDNFDGPMKSVNALEFVNPAEIMIQPFISMHIQMC